MIFLIQKRTDNRIIRNNNILQVSRYNIHTLLVFFHWESFTNPITQKVLAITIHKAISPCTSSVMRPSQRAFKAFGLLTRNQISSHLGKFH